MKEKNILYDDLKEIDISVKTARTETWVFIICCLAATGIMALFAAMIGVDSESTGVSLLLMLSCMMPAITAIIISGLKKYSIEDFRVFPRLRQSKNVYLTAILAGLAITLISQPLEVLFFPNAVKFSNFNMAEFVFSVLFLLAASLIEIITLLGEEVGWLGFLFPRLEKLHGTVFAVVLMGIIRGVWHFVMYLALGSEDVWFSFMMLTINNVFLDSLFICLLKKSSSIIPATLVHAINNTVANAYITYVVMDEVLYKQNIFLIQIVSVISSVIVGVVCYTILFRWIKKQNLETRKASP